MRFISPYANYRIVLEPTSVVTTDNKRKMYPGVVAEFSNGMFVTEDEDLIKKLMVYPTYRTDFIATEVKEVEKEKKCPICGKVCKSPIGLRSHLRIHKEGKK